MSAAEALATLQARLTEALHHPVSLGPAESEDAPRLVILIHSMSPVPDVVKMTGRHLADQATVIAWVIRLTLKGEADGLLAQVRMVEAAAANIDQRPVLGGNTWRADITLEQNADWLAGEGAAVGVRLKVAPA
jgi:2,3-bisphosphoglycerate-independent phosphoglycerate mutase